MGLFCFWTHSASVAHNPLSANNAAACLCIADCGRPMVARDHRRCAHPKGGDVLAVREHSTCSPQGEDNLRVCALFFVNCGYYSSTATRSPFPRKGRLTALKPLSTDGMLDTNFKVNAATVYRQEARISVAFPCEGRWRGLPRRKSSLGTTPFSLSMRLLPVPFV